jgi:hypothetical protein
MRLVPEGMHDDPQTLGDWVSLAHAEAMERDAARDA